ncbi:hypothetical protein PGTUg99_033522 [Puccinia graminis f. sp. tritici]|uniref:Uncharacterized protein n=1 Tax=Puccinia graminis f. sp. tritici TaxID=56615 RepID=A0A5B0R8T9_PUCGR|nr:hypothetical protein PGTUg99_033522 [Puccinia graminis f. sp. tritici]
MAYDLIEMGGIQIPPMLFYSVRQFHLTQHLIVICAQFKQLENSRIPYQYHLNTLLLTSDFSISNVSHPKIMNQDITTSKYSENDGPDDPPSPISTATPTPLSDNQKRDIITSLLLEGWKGPDILSILQEEYAWSISLRTLSCLQMRSQLLSELGVNVCHQTVERYLRRLKLKQRQNDLANGKITREEVVELVIHARDTLLANTAGYQRMRQILVTNYGVHLLRLFMISLKRWTQKAWK